MFRKCHDQVVTFNNLYDNIDLIVELQIYTLLWFTPFALILLIFYVALVCYMMEKAIEVHILHCKKLVFSIIPNSMQGDVPRFVLRCLEFEF